MLDILTEAVQIALSWPTIGFLLLGLFTGILFGATPGMGSSLGMAIVLPLTVRLQPHEGIILLVSMYSGAMYGGSIASILLNVPGTASAAATTFDGYPLSRKGKAKDALAISAVSSSFSGFLTVALLFLMSPLLVSFVLLFGSPEYFLISLLGLTMITIISRGSMVKGLVAGMLGLQLTTIGISPIQPIPRYTFGQLSLYNGISFVVALIGLFAITEMLFLVAEKGGISKKDVSVEGSIFNGIKSSIVNLPTLIKSSLIGLGVGSIPGAGATVSTFIAYTEAVRSSSNPDSFGEGNEKGVVSTEAANNATVGGSLIPTLTFGVPGSPSSAVLLGGIIMHGLIPGPSLFSENLATTYSMFVALFIGNIVILGFGLLAITRLSYLTKIDSDFIIPLILVLSAFGALSVRSNLIDLPIIAVFGFIGYYLRKHNYSLIAFVLGIVLGPIAEQNLLRSLQLSGGSLSIFVTRPTSLILVILIVLVLFGPFIKPYVYEAGRRIATGR